MGWKEVGRARMLVIRYEYHVFRRLTGRNRKCDPSDK